MEAMRACAMVLLLAAACDSAAGVWPPPKTIALTGPAVSLAPNFKAVVHPLKPADGAGPARLARAIDRFNAVVARAPRASVDAGGAGVLTALTVEVADVSEALGIATNYSYELSVAQARAGTLRIVQEAPNECLL